MATNIFLNLPVKDLNKSVEFFTKLGYTFNQQFTSPEEICMIVSDMIYVMLLVESYFKSFITKKIADTKTTVEALIGLSAESKEAVDKLVDTAIAAGENGSVSYVTLFWCSISHYGEIVCPLYSFSNCKTYRLMY